MKLSIIIPVYDEVATIEEIIKRVRNASLNLDKEIIIVDDGSTDDTKELLVPYTDRIKYVYKKNGGACSARNLGIRLFAGEYIGFFDCDGMYLPKKLS